VSLTLNARKIAIVLSLVAVLLALQSLYAEYVLTNLVGIDADTAPARVLDLFSVNLEESLPTWFSTINLFLAACLLAWIAAGKRVQGESGSGYWIGLALIFLYLSMDEGSAIHETASGPMQDAFNTSGFLEFGWLMLGVPLVALFGIVYVRFWWRLPARTRLLFVVAAGLYVGGAVVIESISANQYSQDGGSSFRYLAIATVEELCEMLGVTGQSDAAGLQLGWRHSLARTAGGFALALVIVNGGLLTWGLALRGETAEAYAPYHFYVLVEELGGEGISLTHFSGGFTPGAADARRTAATLLASYPAVQVLSLPGMGASIAVASDTPVLTSERVIQLMEWIDETEFIFYDTPVVQAMVEAG
jgi:hypothetical protein